MGIKTLVIAPYPGLMELVNQMALRQHVLDVTVKLGDLEEAIPIAKKAKEEGFEVVISRGGTAELIKDYTTLPVVEIFVTGYDIIRTLMLVKDYSHRIEMIGFPNICRGFDSVCNLMDISVPYTVIQHQREVEEAIIRAKKKGVRLIIGDTITNRLAKSFGLQGVLITSGQEAIAEAFSRAKELYDMFKNITFEKTVFEKMLNSFEESVIAFRKDGTIFFANAFFYKQFQMVHDEEREVSLFDYLPALRTIVEQKETNRKFIVRDRDLQRFRGNLTKDESKNMYFVRLYHDDPLGCEAVDVVYTVPNISLNQLLGINRTIKMMIDSLSKTFSPQKPIGFFGEAGTGKRYLAYALHQMTSNTDDLMFEVTVPPHHSKKGEEVVNRLLQTKDPGTIYLLGFENMDQTAQQNVLSRAEHSNKGIIFAFNEHLPKWLDCNVFAPRFIQRLDKRWIFLPPLRDRLEVFNEVIHTLLSQFNEQYGKQIVGIRQHVLDDLHKHPWPGNLKELKKTIERLVKETNGEYIEGKPTLQLKDNCVDKGNVLADGHQINLNQTLEEMEKQIIEMVLREENMNQSKTAKRLGINRTTLWRKLKK